MSASATDTSGKITLVPVENGGTNLLHQFRIKKGFYLIIEAEM
jgi:hypothetical protein